MRKIRTDSEFKIIKAVLVKVKGCQIAVYRHQATAAFSNSGTAADETNDKKQRSDSNDHHCRDKGVDVLKKMIIIIICYKNICSYVAQYTCGSLG